MFGTAIRLGAALASLVVPAALASGQTLTPADAPSAPVAAASDRASAANRGDGGAPIARQAQLTEAELAGNRAGETIVAGNQTLSAVTMGNVLNGNYTAGSVVLSDHALSNFNGVGNFAINTGAQVSLQSGLNLTVNVAP